LYQLIGSSSSLIFEFSSSGSACGMLPSSIGYAFVLQDKRAMKQSRIDFNN
jgi:hypothetical protein